MLYLIGTGLKPNHLTLEAQTAVKDCSQVYLEYYTSRLAEENKSELEKKLGKKIELLNRSQTENGLTKLVSDAKQKNIAVLVIGNPLIATTHIEFLLEAQKQSVALAVVPGISILDLIPQTGLDAYKFGRISTIVFQEANYSPDSFFDFIQSNYKNGLHSLCLLDIRAENEQLMAIPHAVEILEKIASQKKQSWFSNTVLIGTAGLSHIGQQIIVGNPSELKKAEFSRFPQSLIVCGKLNEKETQTLQQLYGWNPDEK